MLSKIFGFKPRKQRKNARLSDSTDDSWMENFHKTERGLPNIDKSQIRLLVFKDHDKKGDKCVLFDSKTAILDALEEQGTENGRQKRRHSADSKLLGEMIFGSVEMTYKGPTVKVHSMRTPPQLLLTNVFALKPHRASHNCTTTSSMSDYLQSSGRFSESVSGLSISSQQSQTTSSGFYDSDEHQMAKSVPVFSGLPSNSSSFQLQNVLEGIPKSKPENDNSRNATFPRTSSGSYQRRLLRSQATCMDYGCQRRNENFNEEMSMRLRRRPKIGIGILFSLWEDRETGEEKNRLFQSFCFSHFPIIESHMHQLKRRIEKALLTFLQTSGKLFQDAVLSAANTFSDNILQLYYAPRIRNPVWLSMLTQPDQCDSICEDLVPQLVNAIELYNTKETNFFLASLLTAVLTYHLAWVTTVTPSSVQARRAYLDKHLSDVLNVLGVSHPYNPLWAQLSDLYGAGGDPTKIARTVILGKDKNLVTMLLHILSYFIRCSEVCEQPMEQAPVFSTPNSSCLSSPKLVDTYSFDHGEVMSTQENNGGNLELISENSPDISDKKVESSDKEKSSGNCLEKALCEQCNKLAVKVKDDRVEDCVFHDRTLDLCSCSSVFAGNSKENKLWKSFLRTSCCDRACRNLMKESKQPSNATKSVTLDDSWLSSNRTPGGSLTDNSGCVTKLSRRHSSDVKSDNLNYQNGMFCIQNDGQTISLDRQSILNMFQSSFPLCPICQGQLSFVEKDFICSKGGIVQSSSDTGLCNECCKLKNCSCEMVNGEFSPNIRFGSSFTVNSDDYSSGISLQSYEGERSSLSNLSIDSGVNVQCVQSSESVAEKFAGVDQPHLMELPEFSRTCEGNEELEEPVCTNPLDSQLFSFGRSLMAGYCDQYLPDFVLHGTEVCTEEQRKYDLKISLEQPVVDSPVLESVLIIGDTNTWECKVLRQRKSKKGMGSPPAGCQSKRTEFSSLVNDFLTSFCNLWEMNMSAQFCLMHLEDKMKEIYLRSKVISEYLLTQKKYVTMTDLMSTFGYGECDLALLMSVIGVHSPLAVSRIPLL